MWIVLVTSYWLGVKSTNQSVGFLAMHVTPTLHHQLVKEDARKMKDATFSQVFNICLIQCKLYNLVH